MISWLLVAVLLFADTAITTPTSTSDSNLAPPAEPIIKTSTRLAETTVPANRIPEIESVIDQRKPDDWPPLERGKQPDSESALGSGAGLSLGGGLSQRTGVEDNESATKKSIETSDSKTLVTTNQKQQQQQQQQQWRQEPKKIYTNQFVIKVEGGEDEARRLAEKHGFIYLNHILGDYYHLEHRRLAKRSLNAFDLANLDISIEEEPHVLTFERQVLKRRVKRDFMDLSQAGPTLTSGGNRGGIAHYNNQHNGQQPQQRQQSLRPAARPSQFLRPPNQTPANQLGPASVNYHQRQQQHADDRRPGSALSFDQLEMNSSGPIPFFLQANVSNNQDTAAAVSKHRPPPPPLVAQTSGTNQTQLFHYFNETSQYRTPAPFNDPSWPLMWYLDGGARNGFDLNVQAAWRMGYTGRGIVITILDDGLEKNHPDLEANYDPLASFDINGDDADPMPRYDSSDSNRHGTRCAGEVAAVPNNNICSVGIAYNSKVGGVRMLDGEVTDAVEARSLSLNNQHIHIYSASWGPDDNGKTVDGPGELATRAFIEGVTYGRGGRGSIFVFASGNGGRENDNCNCDGYTNSIWTLSISSASENGGVPWYIENCSSTLATTYSSGSLDERQIATTDIRHSCTRNHTGTSASAPIAAGICALVLEANPELTWRDMQHIVVRTAKPANLMARDWRTNAMGRNVSHAFGYGLMDAAAMILTAKRWRKMPDQYSCKVESPKMEKFIPSKGYIELKLRVECAKVRFIEHVQSLITLTATRRGDLHIYLTSPHGTRSTLLAQRPMDVAEQGFRNWPFMTVHSWGESPNGIWTLEVHNDGKPQTRAVLKEWNLTLYGTYDDPNRHLDSVVPSSQPPQATHSPPTSITTTTTPAPREPSGRQHHGQLGQSPLPPPPSFSPVDYDLGRPNASQRPPVSGGVHLASSHGPPPPISGRLYPTTVTATSPAHHQNVIPNLASTAPPTGSAASIKPDGQLGGNNQTSGEEHQSSNNQAAKVDFEVVAPPDGQAEKPKLGLTQTSNSARPMPAGDQFLMNSRPHIQVIDSNKIDTNQINHQPELGSLNQTTTTTTSTSRPIVSEFDSNQLDSKQTKDYRSSGQHDVTSTSSSTTSSYNEDLTRQTSADLAANSEEAPTKPNHPNGHSNSAASSDFAAVFLLVACLVHQFGLMHYRARLQICI